MQDFTLELAKRTEFSKKARSQSIESGHVLGNVYGAGVDSIAVEGPYQKVYKTVKEAGKNHPITLKIADTKEPVQALVHEVEYNPRDFSLHHVTFKIIKKGEKVKTDIPVDLLGDAPATQKGLVLVTVNDQIPIETIPSKIPEIIEVDISGLEEEGDTIRVADLKLDDEVDIQLEEDVPIVRIEAPRAVVAEEEEESEEDEEGSEGAEDSEESGDSEENSDDTPGSQD